MKVAATKASKDLLIKLAIKLSLTGNRTRVVPLVL